ncbi:WD40 repeat domain-containing protein [Paenibacillus ehimensis]|uniref:WD40 repeat domain-containing protein n=1 Tax=Paenibacillus ehimensis TaxID=79264 RepID=UPI000FD9AC6C|nr:hypothetical protein [Paenibacillus ehimensis]
MERTLTDRITNKTWSIRQSGNQVYIASNGGKAKEKGFDEPEQAAKYVQKETWSRLKKGFVLHNPQAGAGQPVLHRYIGGGYTGFMPLAATQDTNTFFCSYVIGQFEKAEIYLMDDQGEKQTTCELPGKQLIFDMRCCAAQKILLLNADHQIAGLSLDNGEIERYTPMMPTSTLSVSGSSALWYDKSSLVVYDLGTNTVRYTRQVECEKYGGHSLQLCAVLSHDGRLMAYCTRTDEIVIVDMTTMQERTIAKDKNAMTSSMAFSPDDRWLFTQEQYGSWSLKCYDLNTMTGCRDWITPEIKSFAIHERRGLLAVYNYGKIQLFDLHTMKPTIAFEVEHVVKNCTLTFTKDYLAVYTDYGCVSLYALA